MNLWMDKNKTQNSLNTDNKFLFYFSLLLYLLMETHYILRNIFFNSQTFSNQQCSQNFSLIDEYRLIFSWLNKVNNTSIKDNEDLVILPSNLVLDQYSKPFDYRCAKMKHFEIYGYGFFNFFRKVCIWKLILGIILPLIV